MPAEPHDDERRERRYREGASSESSHDAEEHAVGETERDVLVILIARTERSLLEEVVSGDCW